MKWFNFKKKLMFEAESIPLEPYQIRLRFRRRIALLSFFIMFALLSIPVVRERLPLVDSNISAKKLALDLIETREQSVKNRAPTALLLSPNKKTWSRIFYSENSDCNKNATLQMPIQIFDYQENTSWRVLYLPPNAENQMGIEVNELCFHPLRGLLVNGEPIQDGWLYIIARPEFDIPLNRVDRAFQILITNYGDKIELASLKNLATTINN